MYLCRRKCPKEGTWSLFLGRAVQILCYAVAWLWEGATFFPLITLILDISSLKLMYNRLEESICFPFNTKRSQSPLKIPILNKPPFPFVPLQNGNNHAVSERCFICPRACEILQCHKGYRLWDSDLSFAEKNRALKNVGSGLKGQAPRWRTTQQWCLFGIK